MPLSVKMARVAGAFRCNRWGKYLEGEDYRSDDDSKVTTLDELLNETRAYAQRLRIDIENRERQIKKKK